MKYLNKSDSSQLFKLFYGGDTATSHKDDEYAEKTVESCAGLPLALKTLGVGNSAGEQKMLSKLKDSLDTFKDDVKACFLFFVLFEDLRDIGQKQLFEYWIGEGLVNAEDTPVFGVTQNERKLASLTRNAEVIVKDLRACCLLEEASDNVHVEMHSIVRKMAFWLAKDGPQASQRLLCCAADVSAKMKGLKRASLVVTGAGINKALEHIPCCQHMVTLLMSVVDKQLTSITLSTSITKHCFSIGKLPSIRVLDMTHLPIEKLPQTFCELKALKYLNLSYTLIKKLPAQLGNLTSLLLLDLTGTSMLKSIPSEAVSTLVSLISLKLADSAYKIVCNPKRKYFGEEELSLKHLEIMTCLDELQLSLQDLNALKRLSECTNLRESTTYLQLFTISFENSNRMLEILGMFKNLNFLSIKTCIFTDAATEEFDKLSICEENRTNIQAPVLPQITIHLNRVPNLKTLVLQDQSQVLKLYISPSRLSRLHISRCTNLITIACLCPLKYLEILEIEDCAEFVELLSLSTASDHQDHTQCLARLKLLKLDCLPKLENISLCYHSLISLEVITIFGCKKLKKFQVMPPQEERKIKIDCEETWWKEFTGTDGVTNPPFVPSFRNVQSN